MQTTDNPTLEKLEPCPFCGVELILLGDYDREQAWNWYGHPSADDSDCLLSQHKIRTKSDLRTPMTVDRKAWNSRAPVVAEYAEGFDDAARVSRVLNQVAATSTPVEQERNWWCKRQPWACRYQNARQCAHDTMLAAEEIRNYVDSLICAPPMRDFERNEIGRIINKHFCSPVSAAKVDAWSVAQQVIADWHNVDKWHDPSMMPIPAFSGAQEQELTRLIAEAVGAVSAAGGDEDDTEPCPHCNLRDCECSDMDVAPDIGAKG